MTSPNTDENNAVRALVNQKIAPLVKEQLHKWYRDLRGEFTQGMVLPTKAAAPPSKPVRLRRRKGRRRTDP